MGHFRFFTLGNQHATLKIWGKSATSKSLVESFSLLKSSIPFLVKDTESEILGRGGAGEGTRTLDINLGKVALYQLSYTRRVDSKLLEGSVVRQDGFLVTFRSFA